MNIEQQQRTALYWLETLEHVVGVGNAICAGGAPRDWWHSRPARDVDIFVFDWGSEYKFKKQCTDVGLHLGNPSVIAKEEYSLSNKVCYIFENQPVQIILRKDRPDQLLDSFDLSLSRIKYNKTGLQPYPDFLRTVESGAVIVSSKCTQNYLYRIQKKYPEYNYDQPLMEF